MISYNVKEENGLIKVGIPVRVTDHFCLNKMAANFQLDARWRHLRELKAAHVAHSPAHRLRVTISTNTIVNKQWEIQQQQQNEQKDKKAYMVARVQIYKCNK